MNKILVAVDGSMASIHAAKKGVELARGLGAEITLVYVSPPVMMPTDVPLSPVEDLRDSQLARGESILKDVANTLEFPPVKTMNLLGAPAEVIADVAMDGKFDLVIVGNKGRGAVSRVLLGSVADRLVHICLKPVMVVR